MLRIRPSPMLTEPIRAVSALRICISWHLVMFREGRSMDLMTILCLVVAMREQLGFIALGR